MLDSIFNAQRPVRGVFPASELRLAQADAMRQADPDRFERQPKRAGQLRFGMRAQVTAFQRLVQNAGLDDSRLGALRREFRTTIVPDAIKAYDESTLEMEKDDQRADATLDHDYGPFNHIDEFGVMAGLAKRLSCTRQGEQIKAYYTDLVMNKLGGRFPVALQMHFLRKMADYDAETAQAAMVKQVDKSIADHDGVLPGFTMHGYLVNTMAEIASPSSSETPLLARIRDLALAQNRTVLGQPNKGGELASRINDAAAFLGHTDCEALVNDYVGEMELIYKTDARKIRVEDVTKLRATCYRYGYDGAQARLDAMKNVGMAEKVRTAEKIALIGQGAAEPVVVPGAAAGMPSMVSVVDLPTMHIRQKDVGDCVLLATIDAIQRNKREGLNILANLAKRQDDGSWLVTFHDTEPIRVQPSDTRGEAYSKFFLFRWAQKLIGFRRQAVEAPDVVRVIERAYGRRLKAEQHTVAGTMMVLDRGTTVLHDGAMRAMIGPRAQYQTFSQGTDFTRTYATQALAYIQENPEYTIAWCGTRPAGEDESHVGAAKKLIGSHAYAIVDVTDRQVVVANPHDNKQLITLTHDEFADGVNLIFTARLPRREK